MVLRGERLETLRATPARALPHEAGLPFMVWMALARATPVPSPDPDQRLLGDDLTQPPCPDPFP